jgi:hypothetical protein
MFLLKRLVLSEHTVSDFNRYETKWNKSENTVHEVYVSRQFISS